VTDDLVRVTEGQRQRAAASPGSFPGLIVGTGVESYLPITGASASYLTGRHSFKVGYQGGYLIDDSTSQQQHVDGATPERPANSANVSIAQSLAPLSTKAPSDMRSLLRISGRRAGSPFRRSSLRS
jgi:hypothetical protein